MVNLIFLVLYSFLPNVLSAQLILIVFSVHCVIILLPYFGQKTLTVNPIPLYIVGVIIVNIADYILIGNIGTAKNISYSYIVPEYVGVATQIWCISSTFIVIGYELAINKSLPAIDITITKKSTLNTIFYCLIVINALQLYGIRLLNISSVLKFIGVANLIGILFYSQLWAKGNDKPYRLFALALFFVQTYIAIFYAFLRIQLILPTVVLFLGYFIGKSQVRYLFTYRIIPFIIIFALYASVFKTLGAYRANFYYAFLADNADNNNIATDQPLDNNKSHALLDRSANLAQLTCVVNLVKKNGFYNGAASAPLVIALIPRFLWPEKPNIAIGKWFALEIGVAYMNDEGNINNSINMTVPGELYIDFGWLGVIIGSLLVGAFVAVLWNASRFYSSEYNILGILFGGNLLILCFVGIGVDLQVIITLLSTYFTFFILKKVLSRK